ncbi:hypothetical protein N5D48_26095 [Pseudomonas sp. GD03858]|uniref:hypothetical protein n=1 Tax=unclassified Pseudomonas TaxID=196821 RepID=UPI002447FC92|nr:MULTISPECIES: hypothetical protein [unclassified Pseudomonas]MDH0650326.1 hypothetical protein [Pseudomonas sp. GD03867]MDH0665879.1 hypothetical protein [Pseudomonas sp. GD03858]
MTTSGEFLIDWYAPITPGLSLAGIPLGIDLATLETVLANYLLEKNGSLYRFIGSPDLQMHRHGFDQCGDCGFSFSVFDDAVINDLLKGIPALSLSIRDGRLYAVKVYSFSFPGDPAEKLIYRGCLPGGITLGNPVSDILPLTCLEFDEAEEWFYTDTNYGVVEITGWGVPISDESRQIITAICVTSGS